MMAIYAKWNGFEFLFHCWLINALHALNKKNITSKELAFQTINFEQQIMGEAVGSQDQVASSFGGFNKIIFNKNKPIKIKKIKKNYNTRILENNLILIYTKINRTAHKIASKYINQLTTTKKNYIEQILEHVEEGEKIIRNGNIDDFGKLLDSSWQLKKKLSKSITNNKIEELYQNAIKSGAIGGKLLGAGGGGFLLMYMKKQYRDKFFKKNPKLINVPFSFSNIGSQVIFKHLNR